MFANNESFDAWKFELVGGIHEFESLIKYGINAKSPLIDILRDEINSKDTRYLAVALARLRRAYELETNSTRLLNNFEIQGLNPWNVVDSKYQIGIVEDAEDPEFIQSAMTEGNEFANPPLPEFLSFYPSRESVFPVFERLRNLLENDELQVNSDEVIEITGILGLLGEVTIRVALLNHSQLTLAHQEFRTGRSSDYPVVLVDIPDSRGYFAWEQGAQEYVAKHFKLHYVPDSSLRVTEFEARLSPPMPCSTMALYDCLNCYIGLSEDPLSQDDEDDEEKSDASSPSLATLRVLLNLLDDMHPDSWEYEGTPEEIANEHIENCCNNLKTYLVPKRASDYIFNELLNAYDEAEPDPFLADIWRLPPPSEIPLDIADAFPPVNEWGDFYPTKQQLLLDVDWQLVKRIVSAAYEDSIEPDDVETCRQINARREESP